MWRISSMAKEGDGFGDKRSIQNKNKSDLLRNLVMKALKLRRCNRARFYLNKEI